MLGDGGINGVKLVVEECETGYKTDVGVECYERTKTKGAVVYNPYSTGITNAIIPKTNGDKIPVLSMGYGLTPAADGRVFPWVFNLPTTYWSQASAFIKYVAEQDAGREQEQARVRQGRHQLQPVEGARSEQRADVVRRDEQAEQLVRDAAHAGRAALLGGGRQGDEAVSRRAVGDESAQPEQHENSGSRPSAAASGAPAE